MDLNIESPFSFELGEELVPLPCLSPSIDIPVPHELAMAPISPLENDNSVSKKPKNGRQRKPITPNTCNDVGDESPNEEHKKKKIIHRDVERQRRKDMSSLYTTLRSLLPLEYLKGKRSICDHMQEAVKYIEYMEGRIQQLSDKRDELKELSDENLTTSTVETLNSSERNSVVVRSRNEGREVGVFLDTAARHRLPVSNILQVLAVEGLEILSCTSTKVSERFFHTIECQAAVNDVGHYRCINASKLQHKLMNLEYFPLD